ncbi:hypothetical protein Q8F55_004853 [Vanrija albida]|uniref:Barwin domain-containing protein n=1 Tax=Vanrija albida TaxID=181172 RepID=A0ABR3PZZ9_9TREE
MLAATALFGLLAATVSAAPNPIKNPKWFAKHVAADPWVFANATLLVDSVNATCPLNITEIGNITQVLNVTVPLSNVTASIANVTANLNATELNNTVILYNGSYYLPNGTETGNFTTCLLNVTDVYEDCEPEEAYTSELASATAETPASIAVSSAAAETPASSAAASSAATEAPSSASTAAAETPAAEAAPASSSAAAAPANLHAAPQQQSSAAPQQQSSAAPQQETPSSAAPQQETPSSAAPAPAQQTPAQQAPANSGNWQHTGGRGTYYAVGLGACGNVNSDSEAVVALNAPEYAGGSHCGKSVTIKDETTGNTATATIVDLCPGCPSGGLDLSPSLFSTLSNGNMGKGVLSLSWNFN